MKIRYSQGNTVPFSQSELENALMKLSTSETEFIILESRENVFIQAAKGKRKYLLEIGRERQIYRPKNEVALLEVGSFFNEFNKNPYLNPTDWVVEYLGRFQNGSNNFFTDKTVSIMHTTGLIIVCVTFLILVSQTNDFYESNPPILQYNSALNTIALGFLLSLPNTLKLLKKGYEYFDSDTLLKKGTLHLFINRDVIYDASYVLLSMGFFLFFLFYSLG